MMATAGLFEVLGATTGVILGLCGLALVLLGLIAIGDGSRRMGVRAALVGTALVAGSLWLVGALG